MDCCLHVTQRIYRRHLNISPIKENVYIYFSFSSEIIYVASAIDTYLIAELSHNLVQSVRLLGEILSLGEQILGCLQRPFAPCELVHGERHRGHVLGAFHYVVVLLEGAAALLPLLRFRVHLGCDQLHLEAGLRDLRLFLAVQFHRFQRLARCSVFLE